MVDSFLYNLDFSRLTEESGSSDAPSQATTKRARDGQDVTSTCMELYVQHETHAATFRNASDKSRRHPRDPGPGMRPSGSSRKCAAPIHVSVLVSKNLTQ